MNQDKLGVQGKRVYKVSEVNEDFCLLVDGSICTCRC